jgi:hypothetical protein
MYNNLDYVYFISVGNVGSLNIRKKENRIIQTVELLGINRIRIYTK